MVFEKQKLRAKNLNIVFCVKSMSHLDILVNQFSVKRLHKGNSNPKWRQILPIFWRFQSQTLKFFSLTCFHEKMFFFYLLFCKQRKVAWVTPDKCSENRQFGDFGDNWLLRFRVENSPIWWFWLFSCMEKSAIWHKIAKLAILTIFGYFLVSIISQFGDFGYFHVWKNLRFGTK